MKQSIGFLILVLLVSASFLMAQSTPGEELYRSNCASCHGADGHGHGPATGALKTPPTDLTMIAKQNNGKFDTRYIRHVVEGDKKVAAHGSREMPSWGAKFRASGVNATETQTRLDQLTEYLHSIQR